MRFDAIVVPQGAEARAVARGWRGQRPVIIDVAAGASAERTLANLPPHASGRPLETALVLGLCGALDPLLRVGDPVVYGRIADGSHTIELDAQFASACALLFASTPRPAAHVPAFVSTAGAKAMLRVTTGAAAIDMEAAVIARALHARGIRVAMVRVVSDDAAGELPNLSDVYDDRGALRPLELARALAYRPRTGLRFMRNALAALAALRLTAQRLSN